jgi:aspartate kinase
VQKFGGTSVGDLDRIRNVAAKVKAARDQGHRIVTVASAMGGETNRLVDLARSLNPQPLPREMDVLLATGEQVSIALLAIALDTLGCPVRSYTGAQVRITTNNAHTKARITHIDKDPIMADLAAGNVVVVAGFQGISDDDSITTLGRGGSDTTAVALASALGADECQIFTELLNEITHEEMLELASLGAKVLQIRAVEFASKYNVPLRVLSTFVEGEGTRIIPEEQLMEQPLISGVAFNRDEAKVTICGVPDKPGIAFSVLGPVAEANIEVDMIVQNVSADDKTDMTFTVHRNDFDTAMKLLEKTARDMDAEEVTGDNRIAKISLVGVGMRSHAGIASKMFETLAAESINIQMISTSEIKISVVVDEKYMELGVRALHAAFGLSESSAQG